MTFQRLRHRIERLSGPVTALGRSIVLVGVVAWIVGARFGWDEAMIVAAACLVAIAVGALQKPERVTKKKASGIDDSWE